MKIMITNGGSHPPDKWAEVTTDSILDLIEIADDSTSPEAAEARAAKRDLRQVLFNIFHAHHDKVQKDERGHLHNAVKTAKQAQNRAHGIHDPDHYCNGGTMIAIDQALAATPFAAHFAKQEVRDVIYRIVGQHTVNAMHIERRWHHDRLVQKGA